MDQFQLLPHHGTRDRLATDLLPEGTSFLVLHEEVLVVDSCEMEREHPIAYLALPHQTGVTERSIGCNDWRASDDVLDHVMISHEPHGISDSFAIVLNRQHHV